MNNSILHDWVMELPLREQGTLLTIVRGCDLSPKSTLDSPERKLVAFLRYCILKPADVREVDAEIGSFMSRNPPQNFNPSNVGHYPMQWVTHIVHALEVVGYRSSHTWQKQICNELYLTFCKSFHMNPETCEEMVERLSEDRIEKGNIVS